MYVSTHQWPAYPGTGRARDVGGAAAIGTNVNVPLPPGATGDAARAAFDEVIVPAVEEFAPTWVLISAGFDAHRDDPLADLKWTAGDYADLTRRVAAFAPGPGRLVAYLEGGYDLDALARSAGATIAPSPARHGAGAAVEATRRRGRDRAPARAIEEGHDRTHRRRRRRVRNAPPRSTGRSVRTVTGPRSSPHAVGSRGRERHDA
jgi:acetoin utilization deacetylase AcuC-like enzyme